MKIVVFSDIHGKEEAAALAAEISVREKAEKTVFCGDIFGRWSGANNIAEKIEKCSGVLYFLKGNNDFFAPYPVDLEDYALMYHFSRALFFTHGDNYNGYRVPPVLKEGDAVIFGHTHQSCLTVRNGIYSLNVGSLAYPRDDEPSYLVLDEKGATVKRPDGSKIYFLGW